LGSGGGEVTAPNKEATSIGVSARARARAWKRTVSSASSGIGGGTLGPAPAAAPVAASRLTPPAGRGARGSDSGGLGEGISSWRSRGASSAVRRRSAPAVSRRACAPRP